MKIVIGDNLDFFGVKLTFRSDRKFGVKMTQILKEVVE